MIQIQGGSAHPEKGVVRVAKDPHTLSSTCRHRAPAWTLGTLRARGVSRSPSLFNIIIYYDVSF